MAGAGGTAVPPSKCSDLSIFTYKFCKQQHCLEKPSEQRKIPYRCIAEDNCSHVGNRRRDTVRHVLRKHVDKSSVPQGCNLCDYKCESLSLLKGHHSWYDTHAKAMKTVAARGEQINEMKWSIIAAALSMSMNLLKRLEMVTTVRQRCMY